jgi:hypothetical protein
MPRSARQKSRPLRSSGPGRLALGLLVGLAVSAVGPATSASALETAGHQPASRTHVHMQHHTAVKAFWPVPDDDTVLPSRVANSIGTVQDAVDRAVHRLDVKRYARANRSLVAVRVNVGRAHRAGMYQITLPVPEESESTAGPDSAVAVLTLEQGVITNLAAQFDGLTANHPYAIKKLKAAMTTANTSRNLMLDAIIALDPEEAGAAYADGMTDTVDGYTDEVANLTEALQTDTLAPAGRAALTIALANSTATAAKVSAAFGGGED